MVYRFILVIEDFTDVPVVTAIFCVLIGLQPIDTKTKVKLENMTYFKLMLCSGQQPADLKRPVIAFALKKNSQYVPAKQSHICIGRFACVGKQWCYHTSNNFASK